MSRISTWRNIKSALELTCFKRNWDFTWLTSYWRTYQTTSMKGQVCVQLFGIETLPRNWQMEKNVHLQKTSIIASRFYESQSERARAVHIYVLGAERRALTHPIDTHYSHTVESRGIHGSVWFHWLIEFWAGLSPGARAGRQIRSRGPLFYQDIDTLCVLHL